MGKETTSAGTLYIAVMGVTGSGKSTFISLGSQQDAKVGHGLQSSTSDVTVYSFAHLGRTINLIDTPGFDDTSKSDTEVLKDIAQWLSNSYSHQAKLSGIVYLHRISDPRMTGSAISNLRMFKKLCGNDSLSSVVLATTFWNSVAENLAQQRLAELQSNPEFWGHMIQKGSEVFRCDCTRDSVLRIINHLIEREETAVLDIQKEMVDQNRELDQTGAGIELQGLLNKQKEMFMKKLEESRLAMNEALQEKDEETARSQKLIQEKFMEKINKADEERESMKATLRKLNETKERELEEMRKQLDTERRSGIDRQREISNIKADLEKLRQSSDNTALSQLESFMSGMWRGYYYYNNGTTDTESVFTLFTRCTTGVTDAITVEGSGRDSVGSFIVQGKVNTSGGITFTKLYPARGLPWTYSGLVNQTQRTMSGYWGEGRGTFSFCRA